MCTVSERPVVAPQSLGAWPGLETNVALHPAKERNFRGAKGDDATVGNPRPRKATLLSEVARMALEGCSGAAIGRELGLPERTVIGGPAPAPQSGEECFCSGGIQFVA